MLSLKQKGAPEDLTLHKDLSKHWEAKMKGGAKVYKTLINKLNS